MTSTTEASLDLFSKRKEDVLCTLNGFEQMNGENNNCIIHEDSSHSSTIALSGSTCGGKNALRPIKLPLVPRLPSYTTWVFLDR